MAKTYLKPERIFIEPLEEETLLSLDELRDFIDTKCKDVQFQPGQPIYNRIGEFIEVYWEEDPCYAENLGKITVMKSQETHRIIGVQINNLFELMNLVEIKKAKEA